MEKEIDELLSILLKEESDRAKLMKGMNLSFGMTPIKMIELGRGQEVINYLLYNLGGPY